tara:strand:- start:89 stop:412 length:324 start_codon:yes stop_codon:yes gene_type:complete
MDAITKIKESYTLEDFKEIASHGCQSGVCSQHIYYGDTISFYEKYEDEIIDYIESNYGIEFLIDMFKDADASLTVYKNNVTWCFIEMIAFEVTDPEDHQELVLEAYA